MSAIECVVTVVLTGTLAVMQNARNTSVKEKNMSGRKSWRSAKRHKRCTTMTASSIGGNYETLSAWRCCYH